MTELHKNLSSDIAVSNPSCKGKVNRLGLPLFSNLWANTDQKRSPVFRILIISFQMFLVVAGIYAAYVALRLNDLSSAPFHLFVIMAIGGFELLLLGYYSLRRQVNQP